MQIYGPSHIHGPHGVQGPHQNKANGTQPPHSAPAQADRVEISAAAEEAAQAAETGSVRQDLVARVREEIAAGTYETPEKFHTALNRLLDEIS